MTFVFRRFVFTNCLHGVTGKVPGRQSVARRDNGRKSVSPRRDNRAKLVSPDGTMEKQLVTKRGQWKASSGVGGDKEGPEKCQRKGDKEKGTKKESGTEEVER